MAHDVFISYSSQDKATADAACATLEARRIRCWIAPRDVLPGIPYAESLAEALERSRVLVLVLSAGSNASRHVMREVESAVDRGIAIIPFRIEDVRPSKSLGYFLKAIHWLDAVTPPLEKHLLTLATTVERLLARGEPSDDVGRPRTPSDSSKDVFKPVMAIAPVVAEPVDSQLRALPIASDWDAKVEHDEHNERGRSLLLRRDWAGALREFRAALSISEATMKSSSLSPEKSDSDRKRWQAALFFDHFHIGEVLSESGDRVGALEEFRKALPIGEQLRVDPAYKVFVLNTCSCQKRIGNALLVLGDLSGAFEAYAAALAIVESEGRDRLAEGAEGYEKEIWPKLIEDITRSIAFVRRAGRE